MSPAAERRQATGTKVGEVTDTQATIWTRITAQTARNSSGLDVRGSPAQAPSPLPDRDTLLGACPGAPGMVRVRYNTTINLDSARATQWVRVNADSDFTHTFDLANLQPGTPYWFAVDTADPDGSPAHGSLRGQFRTAPAPNAARSVTFCVVTGQMYRDLDHEDGFHIYPAISALNPDFLVLTGDNVYYDNEAPKAINPSLARYHWERMYSLPRHVELMRRIPAYWEKDDHDLLDNDCWPGQTMGDLTFSLGQRLFREQTPVGDTPYRTFRWGKALQIWLTEGRDFRSPNTDHDGPDKTIWGERQWSWLRQSLQASDASWKVLISPTPIVGPDRAKKNDNHANRGFAHEGNRIRSWFQQNMGDNFFVACGDRHWQYHSIHPTSGVQEFSCGPASNQHAGGTPGAHPDYHRYHKVQGGFLSVQASPTTITFRFHGVHGDVAYAWSAHNQ
jgi:alkaline phosphatase D